MTNWTAVMDQAQGFDADGKRLSIEEFEGLKRTVAALIEDESRFNPHHDKAGKFAKTSGAGFGTFTKSEKTVLWGGIYVRARVWSSGQHTIAVTDSKFSDEMVETRLIPTINRLQGTNPLSSGESLNVSVEPSLFHNGHTAYGVTLIGSGNIKLHGGLLSDGADAEIAHNVEIGHTAPAAKNVGGLESVVIHEWGHAITHKSDDQLLEQFYEVSGEDGKRISKYADKSKYETQAEMFLEFYASGGKTNDDEALAYAGAFGWQSS